MDGSRAGRNERGRKSVFSRNILSEIKKSGENLLLLTLYRHARARARTNACDTGPGKYVRCRNGNFSARHIKKDVESCRFFFLHT